MHGGGAAWASWMDARNRVEPVEMMGRAPLSCPPQVLIQWSLAKGFVTLPKSTKPERQRENLAAAGGALGEGDLRALDALEEGLVTGWDPITEAPV